MGSIKREDRMKKHRQNKKEATESSGPKRKWTKARRAKFNDTIKSRNSTKGKVLLEKDRLERQRSVTPLRIYLEDKDHILMPVSIAYLIGAMLRGLQE